MIPPRDDYPVQLRRVISRLLDEGREAALEELRPIAYPPRVLPMRPVLPIVQRLAIHQRDGWRCRYCGCQTILTPVMGLLGSLFPESFPYHRNWKAGETHPAIVSRSAVVDHIRPGSLNGSWTDLGNLATACWLCNVRKADLSLEQLGWTIRPIPLSSEWDGLTGRYEELWKIAGRPAGQHAQWIAALRSAAGN